MELLPTPPTAPEPAGPVFRRSPVGDGVLALVTLALVLAGAVVTLRVAGLLPWWMILPLAPVPLFLGLLFGVISTSLFGAFRAGLRPTNWLAQLGGAGLFLNLRSYRNAHFGGEDTTVLHLRFDDIASIARVGEARVVDHGDGPSRQSTPYLELRLRGCDTTPIADALERECARPAPTRAWLGIQSTTRHHHAPVIVPEPGVVRVEWHRRLFEALGRSVRVADARRVDLDSELAGASPEARVRALVERGDRIGAIVLAESELGLSKAEAKTWLDGGDRPAGPSTAGSSCGPTSRTFDASRASRST